MAPELKLAIRLQELDTRIEELRREIVALPKQIAEIEKTLESHMRKVEADRAALQANQRDRRHLELEVQSEEQRLARLKDQTMQAKTNEQLWAFQHEIQYVENRIRQLEDRILDLMAESERLEQNLKAAEAALAQERQQVEQEKQRAREQSERDRKLLEELTRERQQVAASLPPSLYKAYERIRRLRKGWAVAEVVDGRCTACHVVLRLQFFQDLRRGEQVMFCESCGRILYYNPPESVEEMDPDETSPARRMPAGP